MLYFAFIFGDSHYISILYHLKAILLMNMMLPLSKLQCHSDLTSVSNQSVLLKIQMPIQWVYRSFNLYKLFSVFYKSRFFLNFSQVNVNKLKMWLNGCQPQTIGVGTGQLCRNLWILFYLSYHLLFCTLTSIQLQSYFCSQISIQLNTKLYC